MVHMEPWQSNCLLWTARFYLMLRTKTVEILIVVYQSVTVLYSSVWREEIYRVTSLGTRQWL